MAVKRHFHLVFAVVLVLAVVAGFAAVEMYLSHGKSVNKENSDLGKPLPDAVFYDAADQKIELSAFKGKVVLVNLWATWCPPCVVELPALDNLQARLKDKDFKVVAIALDRSSITTVESFLRGRDITHLTPYWDKERQVPMKWRYDGLPTSFLLDKEGNVVQRFDGPYTWDKGDIADKIEAMLK